MTRARSLLALAAMTALSTAAPLSCRGATALHFVVCFDFDASATIRLVRVRINNGEGVSITSSTGQEVTITSETPFPLRFSVYAAGNLNETVSVTVDALTNTGGPSMRADYSARAIARFVAGEVRTVPILVQRACTGMLMCPADQSCVNGACMAIEAATTAYAANATCGASTGDASTGADATANGDGGQCPAGGIALNVALGTEVTRVTNVAVANNGMPNSGLFRVAAIGQTATGSKLFFANVRMGTAPVIEGSVNSSPLEGSGRALSFTRSTVVAATDARLYFSANGANATLLSPWNNATASGPIAGTFAGMIGNEVQICGFANGNLTCKSYSESAGTLTALAMDPPPVPMTVGDATFTTIEESGVMTAPLVGAIRTANSLGRCTVVSMGMMPSCTLLTGLPMFSAATAGFTAPSIAAQSLAVALVDTSGAVRAAVVASGAATPTLTSLGAAASGSPLAVATASTGELLVAANERNRVSLFRMLNDGRPGPQSTIATSNVGAEPVALRRAETVPPLGEQFVLAHANGANTVQVRLVAAGGCR